MNFKLHRFKFFFLALYSAVFLSGCRGSSVEANLRQTVEQYYSYEKHGQWESSYDMRTSNFKAGINKEYYISQMEKDNTGWQLLEWQVIDVALSKNKATVVISFSEKLPQEFAEDISLGLELESGGLITLPFLEDTEWVYENGTWSCTKCGKRLHLTLN